MFRSFLSSITIRRTWVSWRLIPTKHWLRYFSAAYYSDNGINRGAVIRMVFLYHQVPKDTRWLVAFLICPSTSPGSFTTNGVRLTVSLLSSIRFCRKELSLFKGDMIYFNVLGQHFLILSSLKRTTDLFEKRSSNYSDRPRLPMLVEL